MTEQAFESLIAPYRSELHAHCYRMLGSVHDAEDALQDTLLRAWRGLASLEERGVLRPWLYRIATNVCLRAVERRPKRVLPIDYGPASGDPHADLGEPLLESVWVEPYPDAALSYEQRESVELAFIAALQHLPARQRAVLILREVLGFTGGEVGDVLDMSTDAVHSALQRAHRTVEARLPERSQQATLRALGDDRLNEMVRAYVDAWERSDVEALAARLAEDAALTMPPRPLWYRGREVVAAFLAARPMSGVRRWRVLPTSANGQPAFGHFEVDGSGALIPHAVSVLTLDGDRIAEITAFLDAEALIRFDLDAA
jgi:RNA polymerase sigma-70 factor, ECF subfamily